MASVRQPTSTTTSSLLVGSIAVHSQSDERSSRLIASSSLIAPALRSRSTAYNASSCSCSAAFDQPLQHRVGSNLEDTSRGTDTSAFSHTGQDAHDELDRGLFAVEERAM